MLFYEAINIHHKITFKSNWLDKLLFNRFKNLILKFFILQFVQKFNEM